jgi:transcriptional regulator with AAA-type ATPase domain
MTTAGRTLLAFVDPKDPFTPGEIAGEDRLGPILSLMAARRFECAFLFHTAHTEENAQATGRELARRHRGCAVALRAVPVSDPKDYSGLMGNLAREVQRIRRGMPEAELFVCVSSGTAEMRAAWFLLTASGALPATMLQIGSPAEPLFGAANVKEVRLDPDWLGLRDLIMPAEYFVERETPAFLFSQAPPAGIPAEPPPEPYPELDPALMELGIFVGSAVLRQAAERAAVAAECDLPVLLLGETGSGKEMFARLIHRLSPRRRRELVAVNCAAMPKDLVESHLFGHVKGAFTGATADLRGKFQQADGGTLFLDEIGELPLEAQAKLLRVVQDHRVEPVGSSKAHKVDVRIVAATNRDLAAEAAAGRFRQDLYYRLEVVEIRLPALRQRRAEIAALALALLERINQRRSRPKQLSKGALARLERHDWPGNARELSNVLERSVLYARGDVVEADDLMIAAKPPGADPLSTLPEPGEGFSIESFLAQVKKQLILRAMAKAKGNQSAAAEMLGVTKQAVSKFLKNLDGNVG